MTTELESLTPFFQRLEQCSPWRWHGRVTKAVGQVVESEGPVCSLGEECRLTDSTGKSYLGEIVGFRGSTVLSVTLETPRGARFGDRISTWGGRPSLRVGEAMLGRVLDATGAPLDGKPGYYARQTWPVDGSCPLPLDRTPIREPLGCGIRAIDAFFTCGRGQRMGIFGGSGVGKSTLISMMARNTAADLTVLALVGERGREVRDFLEGVLGAEGLRRSVVIVSTSDQSPLLRIRAALAATAVAEYFAAQGRQVLLVLDSLTRFAMAQREIGLAAGEPPTAKAYTPSVFGLLARLIERVGSFGRGSITAFYTVLMEGDDQQDPLVDAVRALLDGHLVLDRRLSSRGHYPPISVLDSLSRLMPAVTSREHQQRARTLRRLLAAHAAAEDLLQVGAYQKGLDPVLDQALVLLPQIHALLQQRADERATFEDNLRALLAIPG